MTQFLLSILNEKILQWINKNITTFIILLLSFGNIYQYFSGEKERANYRQEIREERARLDSTNTRSLAFERSRSSSLEDLLASLLRLKMYSTKDSTNNNDKK